jgi:D-alanine-D-alanine ligase
MEILFKDKSNPRPVYDYEVKQDWEKHVEYACPAKLTPTELRAIERAARETFLALDCRDVARVDLRMDAEGRLYVLEVNPLPGLTPGYSDLVLISQAVGIEYDSLIAEIMSGGLRRLREKRREDREETSRKEAPKAVPASSEAAVQAAQAQKLKEAAEKAEKAAEKAEKAAKRIAKLAEPVAGAKARAATQNGIGNGNGAAGQNGHANGAGTANGTSREERAEAEQRPDPESIH